MDAYVVGRYAELTKTAKGVDRAMASQVRAGGPLKTYDINLNYDDLTIDVDQWYVLVKPLKSIKCNVVLKKDTN